MQNVKNFKLETFFAPLSRESINRKIKAKPSKIFEKFKKFYIFLFPNFFSVYTSPAQDKVNIINGLVFPNLAEVFIQCGRSNFKKVM